MSIQKAKKKSNLVFKIGLRVSLYASALVGILVFLALFLIGSLQVSAAIYSAVISSVTTGLVTYFLLQRIQQKRLKDLHSINRNIAKKRFKDYEDTTTRYDDEIDRLIRQSVRASNLVEKEIQRLNQIENYRKEFIGDISHELKTPIFAIQGFIETLLNGALHDDEVNVDFLKKAMRNVNRLIFLTKDLMEISKLETGELKSNIEEVYLHDIVLDVLESLNYKAQKEEVGISFLEFDPNLQVYADRNQVKQVLINLVENGVKYNLPGGTVTVSVEDNVQDDTRVLVNVQDTGIGIDENDLERVTERFFRVDKSRSREKGGTGLGLAIVKHIMEAHGEHVYIESKVNEGSTFSFTLKKVELTTI